MSSMPNWGTNHHRRQCPPERVRRTFPDTLRGVAMLGNAGNKTNRLDAKTRELIALAVAVTTRCDGCIAFHAAEARKLGITTEEVAEARRGREPERRCGSGLQHSRLGCDG